MAKDADRKLAEQLFIDGELTQKEIAERLGISEKTISVWKTKYRWDELLAAKRTSRSNLISNLYSSINQIVNGAQDKKRPLTPAEADSIHKLSSSIEKIQGGKTLSNYVSALTDFLNWLREFDLDAAKVLAKLSKEFLLDKAKNA